jgi:hypothetical protein
VSKHFDSLRSLGLLLATLALCACNAQSTVVAQVGERAITAEDVAYRQAVIAIRSGEEAPAFLALFQLLEEALMAEVGREYGGVVSEEMLAEEAARVESESRDPQMLARIRVVFGEDEAAYRRLVIEPILVNQLLHARFSLGHDIQAEPLARAEEILVDAMTDPALLPSLADEFRGTYQEIQIVDGHIRHDDPEQEELPSELAQYDVEWSDYDRAFVEEVVEGLGIGYLHPQVVEDRYSFMVVRLLSRDGDDALLESVVIPKLAFEPWFQTQSQRVTLVVNDRSLREALLAEVDAPYIIDRLLRDQ